MILFWIGSIILTLILALVIILPLTRGRAESSQSRNQLNTQLYKQRLQELEQDRELGLLEEGELATQELKQSLLDDVVVEQPQHHKRSIMLWLPAVVIVILVAYVGYFQMGAYDKVSDWQDSSERLGELAQKYTQEPLSPEEKVEFLLALRTKLYQYGDRYEGWWLSGRLALELGDGENAQEALEKAMRLTDTPETLMVPYAQALAMSGEELRAENIIKKELAKDANNLAAWRVFALMAMQQNNLSGALARWEQVLERAAPDSQVHEEGEYWTDLINQRLGEDDQADVTGPRYQVEVNTDSNTPYHPGAILFVYAMDAGGDDVPIVAQRIENPTFPLTVTLSNSDAMRPNVNLNGFDNVIIKARLAPSGNVSDKKGAWEGRSGVLNTDEDRQLSVVIDTEL
ncbi:c-type cytochrome biogenesis protein CcmI [Oceanisphaera avium]|uniref:C-type cytochrome biogenesis protein CcmI n=1 Tax=Oceanisphaera avium TaxID=1903694 RepID=A0A1Y0CWI6_9GAMM|nr:c-type cytochrome biogenesis protein CcmI [Oceanisphaera avium]ART79701.1 c-type cytochrome biogenesis protein CcmI [Oceanisphaera avium]